MGDREMTCYCEECFKKQEEIEQLKADKNKMAIVNNSLIMTIVSTIPFKGEIGGSTISVIEQLRKLIKAYDILPKIKKLAEAGSEQEDCYACEEILSEVNEVLTDDI